MTFKKLYVCVFYGNLYLYAVLYYLLQRVKYYYYNLTLFHVKKGLE